MAPLFSVFQVDMFARTKTEPSCTPSRSLVWGSGGLWTTARSATAVCSQCLARTCSEFIDVFDAEIPLMKEPVCFALLRRILLI